MKQPDEQQNKRSNPKASGVDIGKLNQAALRRWLSGGVTRDYRDPQYPQLRLRANRARSKASVFLVLNENNKTPWKKLGEWPGMCMKTLTEQLPVMLAERAADGELACGEFTTVGALLEWYAERVGLMARYSDSWRSNVKSLVGKHLLPRLGSLALSNLRFVDVDEKLVIPMTQEGYAQGYIREAVSKLRTAMAAAAKRRLIDNNPLAGYAVAESVGSTVADTRLFESDLDLLFIKLRQALMPVAMLFLLMMMFGTRINETRQARWEHFAGGIWVIPASHTKSGQEHRLPLTKTAQRLIEHYRRWQLKHVGKRAWLFPGRDVGPVSIRTAQLWSEQLRFKHFTSHDLRKLMRTVVADLGVDTVIGERLLNHALPVLLRTYVKSTLDRGMSDALELYHQHLIEQGFAKVAPEIIPRSSADLGEGETTLASGWL